MSQLENYKECLETFNKRCESDKEFQALAESDLTKALSEVGITDIKDFVDFTIEQGRAKMSDDEMNSVAGGLSTPFGITGGLMHMVIRNAYQEANAAADQKTMAFQAALAPVYATAGVGFGNAISGAIDG